MSRGGCLGSVIPADQILSSTDMKLAGRLVGTDAGPQGCWVSTEASETWRPAAGCLHSLLLRAAGPF